MFLALQYVKSVKVMKTITLKAILSIAISIILTSNVIAQEKITSQQWQADLDYLQEHVHSEYPFLFKKITQTSKKF